MSKTERDLNEEDMLGCKDCFSKSKPKIACRQPAGCVRKFYGTCQDCGQSSSISPSEAIAVVRWNYEQKQKMEAIAALTPWRDGSQPKHLLQTGVHQADDRPILCIKSSVHITPHDSEGLHKQCENLGFRCLILPLGCDVADILEVACD